MAKRVKKRLWLECGSIIADEQDGTLVVTQGKRTVALTADECFALGMTAVLEDVPEPKSPGQRLYDEVRGCDDATWDGLDSADRAVYERHARNLGIEPEGES